MRTGNRFILVGISLARVLRSVLLPSRSPHFVGSQYSLSIPPPPLGSRLTSARRARLRRWDGYRGVEGRVNEWGVNEEPAWREKERRRGSEESDSEIREAGHLLGSVRSSYSPVSPSRLTPFQLLPSLWCERECRVTKGTRHERSQRDDGSREGGDVEGTEWQEEGNTGVTIYKGTNNIITLLYY